MGGKRAMSTATDDWATPIDLQFRLCYHVGDKRGGGVVVASGKTTDSVEPGGPDSVGC